MWRNHLEYISHTQITKVACGATQAPRIVVSHREEWMRLNFRQAQ